MNSFPYLLSDKTLTVIVNNHPYQTDRSNPNWQAIKVALQDTNTTPDELIALVNPITAIASQLVGQENIEVRDGAVWYGNEQISNALASRILDVLTEGFDIEPWVKFANNIYANPYSWAREELYLFLEKASLPITHDGCFLAYKRVRNDYLDIHSGTMSNTVGRVVEMPGGRHAVDPDRNNTCSTGLHFCSKEYLPHFGNDSGNRVMLVKINPADVVSIPNDYDNTKGRTWRYEVVGEIDPNEAHTYLWPAVSSGYGSHQWGPEDWLDSDDDEFFNDDLLDAADDEEAQNVVNSSSDVFGIQTISCGLVTKEVFNHLLDQYKSMAGIAKAKGISSGTVQTWKVKLGI